MKTFTRLIGLAWQSLIQAACDICIRSASQQASNLNKSLNSRSTMANPVPANIQSLASIAPPNRNTKALRVVQWQDPKSGCNGNMRIFMSGRFNDVCDELERLAAIESA